MLGFFPSLSNLTEVSVVVALSEDQGAATRHTGKILRGFVSRLHVRVGQRFDFEKPITDI